MRFWVKATIVALPPVIGAASGIFAADAVTQCASAQLKAVGAIYQAFAKEATRACVAGSAGNPQPINTATLIEATNKLNAVIDSTTAKFGPSNCFQTAPVDPANVIDLAQDTANNLCLVPSPTPTPP